MFPFVKSKVEFRLFDAAAEIRIFKKKERVKGGAP